MAHQTTIKHLAVPERGRKIKLFKAVLKPYNEGTKTIIHFIHMNLNNNSVQSTGASTSTSKVADVPKNPGPGTERILSTERGKSYYY
jgi:hypothetical protein